MRKRAALAARVTRAAAVGAVAVSLPLVTAACSSSTSTASTTTATTISPTALLGTGCKQIPASTISALRSGKGISDVLKNPMFSQLSKQIAKAKVGPLFNSVHRLTIIAPTNEAFAKMPKALAKQMKNPASRMMILKGLAVGTQVTPVMFVKGDKVPTLAGTLPKVSKTGSNFNINGVPVVCGNIMAGQTTVYIVGSVMNLSK